MCSSDLVEKPLLADRRDVNVPHGLEGRSQDQAEGTAFRVHEGQDRDLVGDLVGTQAGRQRDEGEEYHAQSDERLVSSCNARHG